MAAGRGRTQPARRAELAESAGRVGGRSADDRHHGDRDEPVARLIQSGAVRHGRGRDAQAPVRLLPGPLLDEAIALFRAKSPKATPGRLYFDILTATTFRRGAWQHADLKAEQGKAPVYLYEIDWETPVDGGKWGSPHSVEHPFVFDNVALSESMVGASQSEPQKIAEQISPTWIAFARTGNPNNPAIPHWPPYTTAERATMVFDTQSKAETHFREDERLLTAKAAEKDVL
ncbi:MAG: carboxylesterase family protein [Xanthobacteraceae bacterium]